MLLLRNLPRAFYKLEDTKNVKMIIVVVTFNSEKFIRKLVRSIKDQKYDLGSVLLLIIDNNSSDNTVENAVSELSGLTGLNWMVVQLTRNYGFAPANNLAIRLAKIILGSIDDKVIVFLNPDTYILSDNFLNIVEQTSGSFPIIGFATISGDSDIVDSLGAYIDFLGNPQDILHGFRLTPSLQKLIDMLPVLYPVHYVCFAAVAVRGDVLEKIGLFKVFYVIYFEDTEYCLRAWIRGVPVVVLKQFLIWHARGGTQQFSGISSTSSTRTMDSGHSNSNSSVNVALHFSKNFVLLSYEYLGILRFILRVCIYAALGILSGRRYLGRALWESMKIIVKYRLRPKRLPRGLIVFNPRTWCLLWALKCLIRYRRLLTPEDCVTYGVKVASLNYLLLYLRRVMTRRLAGRFSGTS